jgi:hypothetical protein
MLDSIDEQHVVAGAPSKRYAMASSSRLGDVP